ncbi:ribonuclease H2 subunit A [Anthonomus grandis grandis]|uniref:ribonuclease H2 subunit A n=1 Tax=Anthonomus grandis grandis TaxID=2921223 RepID=UPI002166490A|nr:ribonuclease H2 subunit A [Anthonomus grandis grandis]
MEKCHSVADSEISTLSTMEINNLLTLENYLSERDNFQNVFYMSPVPDACKEYPCILGIDEAGRGPVLGPMVYGTAFIPINDQMLLETLECADSKALNEEKRDKIFDKICEQQHKMGWGVEVIAPNSICNSMLSRSKYSLNQVSMDSAIGLIKAALAAGVKVEHVFVDTVGKPEKYEAYLKSVFPSLKNITVAKKADSTYPVVSAASICAKVTRDHALKVWNFTEGVKVNEFGSGYPGDPVTKKFLVNHCDPVFGYPQLVRFSWSTAENALEQTAYHVEWEEAEDEEKTPPPQTTAITSFFKVSNKKELGKPKQRHEFFTQRGLGRDVEF